MKKPSRPKIDDDIDENLRRVYRDMLDQQVPDRFAEFFEQLKKKERDGGSSD